MRQSTDLKGTTMHLNAPKTVRKITPQDYPLIESWFKARGREMPKNGTLSDLGYIVDNRVAGWLYLTNSNIAMIENIIADPNTVPSLRRGSLKKLIGYLIDLAFCMGYTHIFGVSQHPKILELSKQFGFKELKTFKVVILSDNEER